MIKSSALYLLGMISIVLLPLKSMAEIPSEDQLKTVFIYNFMRFSQWPEDKIKLPSYQACIYPANRFGDLFLQLEQQKIAGKKIEVKELSLLEGVENCHIVFLDALDKNELEKAVGIAEKNHVLTVSDQPRFAENGGMIQLLIEEGKVRFNVNHYRSQQATVEINSKLIGLAVHVIRKNSKILN